MHSGFSYRSLFDIAKNQNTLPTTDKIFAALNTADFEHVLQVCWHANLVNNALGQPVGAINQAYVEVRDSLIAAVRSVHCLPGQIDAFLPRIAAFASGFETVVSFNYDLTLYWAMLQFNEAHVGWFKDAFLNGIFDPTWPRLRAAIGKASGTTLVFYAHGSLLLARDVLGQERKIAAQNLSFAKQTALLDTIFGDWTAGTHTPLFVSEGTSKDKLASIRRSPYLSTVYDEVLSSLGDMVVVYGLSFAANDTHIIESMKKKPPQYLAVSVYTGVSPEDQQAYCHSVTAQIKRHLPMTQLIFFDSRSAGCWGNP